MNQKMKLHRVLPFFPVFFLWSCFDLEKIAARIEKHPSVEEVIFVTKQPDDLTDEISVGVKLKNGGFIVLSELNTRLGGQYTRLQKFGPYRFYMDYLYYEVDRWDNRSTFEIRLKWLEEQTGHSLRSLKSILDQYDTILSLIEKVYYEPSLPEETWDPDLLKGYSGYITGDDFRMKLYVCRTEEWDKFLLYWMNKIENKYK